jgi:hypothetical protein
VAPARPGPMPGCWRRLTDCQIPGTQGGGDLVLPSDGAHALADRGDVQVVAAGQPPFQALQVTASQVSR